MYVNFTYFYVPVLIAVLLTVTASLLVKFNRFYPYLLFYSLKKNKT
ncbi:MAG: Photosystem I reaction center subunit IX [cyanobacterium endosymbiont of Epithemia adnata isolate EadnSB Bon19]